MVSKATESTGLDTFQHVVVIIMENRSFDHFLGFLYNPDKLPQGKSFNGVMGKHFSNPVPGKCINVPVSKVKKPYENIPQIDTPEPYADLNIALFNTIQPPKNKDLTAEDMLAPYNVPFPGAVPNMEGFVNNYITYLTRVFQQGRFNPLIFEQFPVLKQIKIVKNAKSECKVIIPYSIYSQIMQCYVPKQLPVLSGLARGFAVFDNWFCDVPTQTNPNRAFFHSATSLGQVNNAPFEKWVFQKRKTFFNLLQEHNVSWAVYYDKFETLPDTLINNFVALQPFALTNFFSIETFVESAQKGTLPQYSFVQPGLCSTVCFANDYHPPEDVRYGEVFVNRIYEAVRTSSNPNGSNAENTLLIVTFDEAGSIFDHVVPPRAVPPDQYVGPLAEQNFTFDRLGQRVPSVFVSAFIDPETIVNDQFQNTSVIRTLEDKWCNGERLTLRDASAPSFAHIFNRSTPRHRNTWPVLKPLVPPPRMPCNQLPVLPPPTNVLEIVFRFLQLPPPVNVELFPCTLRFDPRNQENQENQKNQKNQRNSENSENSRNARNARNAKNHDDLRTRKYLSLNRKWDKRQ